MISKIDVCNYKCFSKKESFELSRINLFTGYNGRGKSSIFQILLMLAQGVKKNKDIKDLVINGSFVELDLYSDIVNDLSNPIQICIEDSSSKIKVDFRYKKNEDNSRVGKICGLIINEQNYFQKAKELGGKGKSEASEEQLSSYPINDISKIFENFYYISADRLGPTKYEEKTELDVLNPIGQNGQFRLNVLNNKKDICDKISNDINIIMDSNDKLKIVGENDENSVLSLVFEKNERNIKSINTGYGYSYILSIVVLLNMVKEGVIFIENPEAHLHPMAQSKLMNLVAKTVEENEDVQIFIETHSEHIINAFRLACAKKDNNIFKDDISIYFFDKDFSVKKLQLLQNGQIPSWPKGFFDQQANDLAEIIKLGL